MRASRWEWRYAAAGLGWGAALGILTGSLVALGSMLDPSGVRPAASTTLTTS
ncbi:MAG: hypothetical protein ACR2FV_07590 [Ornithinimicrobium sp.]|jgi:hypothetical protein|uniref:hypothetical protein n=1 Tax=Ornithinimicrobium sp. TaxID=1977084 RepID=UPI003D9B7AA3